LIDLTFEGLAVGSTPLTFSAVTLSNSSSQSIPVSLQHGILNAGYISYAVSGAIFAQGQASRAGIPTLLGVGPIYGQGPFSLNSAPDYDLNILFPAIPNGDAYIFTTQMPRALNIDASLGKDVTVSGAGTILPPLNLLSGNAIWTDNTIDTADLDAIRDDFDALGNGLDADVNFDGVVNIQDLALAGGNFGLTAVDAYSGWLP
jgi:hypothetical protein